MRVLVATILTLACGCASAPAPALRKPVAACPSPTTLERSRFDVAGIEDAAAFEAFFRRFKLAVGMGARRWVARSVSYPLVVHESGRSAVYSDEDELLAHWGEVFDDRVRDAVLAQDTRALFANWQGVMVGRGDVWFSEIEGEGFRVTAINR